MKWRSIKVFFYWVLLFLVWIVFVLVTLPLALLDDSPRAPDMWLNECIDFFRQLFFPQPVPEPRPQQMAVPIDPLLEFCPWDGWIELCSNGTLTVGEKS